MTSPTYQQIESRLEEALAGGNETTIEEMAKALGIPVSKDSNTWADIMNQRAEKEKGKTPPREVAPGLPVLVDGPGRGALRRHRGPRGGRGGHPHRGASRAQASEAIAGMMKAMAPQLPTETDVMERKVDQMSEASGRLAEELEEERQARTQLEKTLSELQLAHNTLATQFTKLASKVEDLTRGSDSRGRGHTVTASSLLSTGGPSESTSGSRSLPAPPQVGNHPRPGPGVARRGRRGGL